MSTSSRTTAAYLDCNATTPTLPIAAEAALEVMKTLYGNPSSSHAVGLQAKHILETGRARAARAVGAEDPSRIIFTSGATEAIQMAVFSVLETEKARIQVGSAKERKLVLYSATEHKAVPQALDHWAKMLELPVDVQALPVDARGQVRMDVLREKLPRTLLLCTMAVNNETGVIQDLGAIESLLRETGSQAHWLVDCVQALGKSKLALGASRIDYATFSGHKLYAPKGIGFLYAKASAPVVPLIVGGGQERGLRSGTENLPGVAAFAAVLEQLQGVTPSPFTSHEKLTVFRERIVRELKRAFPKVEFNTPFELSVPTTINFSVPGFSSKELLDLFDSAGVRLSAGSACSSTSVLPSPVLDAMGFEEWRSVSALRLSFGPCTSEAEIDRGCRAIREAAQALQSSCLINTVGGFEAPESLRDGVIQLRVGATNSWIVADREARTCVVIDPCETVAERIEGYVRCQDLRVVAVLDTHSHADHESIRPLLLKVLSSSLADPQAEFDRLGWPTRSSVLEEVSFADGTRAQAIRLGANRVLARVATPGHTDDSHALILGRLAPRSIGAGKLGVQEAEFAFCGDTILSGGLGRTNFTMSDSTALFESLRKLSQWLGDRTLLCPAHDYDNSFATTLQAEAANNDLLRLAVSPLGQAPKSVLDLFVRKKKEVDSKLENLEKQFHGIVCGVSGQGASVDDQELVMSSDQVRAGSKKISVIDVREPHEYALFHQWKGLGLFEAPRNVPLSRFVNYMRELIDAGEQAPSIVLVCRSGNRSLQAAKTLRRMGLPRAWSLQGGVALL